MNQNQTANRCVCFAILAIVSFATTQAQDVKSPLTPETAPSTSVDGSSDNQDAPQQQKTFPEIVTQIRKNEQQINQLFSTIPIGFPEEQKSHMSKIEQLRADNIVLKDQMESAALESFREQGGTDARAARIVFNMLSNKLDVNSRDGFFDPLGALEIADLMLKTNSESTENPAPIPATDVAYQAFRASFAVEDFERADMMLKQIESAGLPLRPAIRNQLEQTREKWNRELTIRRQESSTDDLPRVKLETTEGDVVIELFENHAPQTVANFINLVEKHVYDELEFFIVVPGEFAQTGCPQNDGSGDPGYKISCECDREQIRHHFSGTLSMVTNGEDTGGSQFRITHQSNSQLDGRSTAFGRVIEGMDVVYRLKQVDKTRNTVNAVEPSKIVRASVIRKRAHDYPFSRLTKGSRAGDGLPNAPAPLDSDQNLTPGG